jgi:CHAT domain-containing protein
MKQYAAIITVISIFILWSYGDDLRRSEVGVFCYKALLPITEQVFGRNSTQYGVLSSSLAHVLKGLNEYNSALPHLKNALAIDSLIFGKSSQEAALKSLELAETHISLGNFKAAETLLRKARVISEPKKSDPDEWLYYSVAETLVELFEQQFRYSEAEPLIREIISHNARFFDEKPNFSQLAENLERQMKIAEAEALYVQAANFAKTEPGRWSGYMKADAKKRGVEFSEFLQYEGQQRDRADFSYWAPLSDLADFYNRQGRYSEAAVIYKHIYPYIEGDTFNRLFKAGRLSQIAKNYDNLGQHKEAQIYWQKSLDAFTDNYSSSSPKITDYLIGFAGSHLLVNENTHAEALGRDALEIFEQSYGDRHYFVADALDVIAEAKSQKGDYEAADKIFRKSLQILEDAHGPNYPGLIATIYPMVSNLIRAGKTQEAINVFEKVLNIRINTYGVDSVYLIEPLTILSNFHHKLGELEAAINSIQRASRLYQNAVQLASSGMSIDGETSLNPSSTHLKILITGEEAPISNINKTFKLGQLAKQGKTSETINQTGRRKQNYGDPWHGILKQRQDSLSRLAYLRRELSTNVKVPFEERNSVSESSLAKLIEEEIVNIRNLTTRIKVRFPKEASIYFEKALSINGVQNLLDEKEALLFYYSNNDATYLWAIKKNHSKFYNLNVDSDDLMQLVKKVRSTLPAKPISKLSEILPFDVKTAYEIYKVLISPTENILKDVSHVVVIPPKALESLPFNLLVTDKPSQNTCNGKICSNIDWFAKKWATSRIPSVSAFGALRNAQFANQWGSPFVGFGDPIFDQGPPSTGITTYFDYLARSSVSGIENLNTLSRLPDTAEELIEISKALKADPDSIYLGVRATEKNVKEASLSNIRVISFATHGLVAGEFSGSNEPGLVLTPPRDISELDDGFLAASEIEELELNAELVILSACNTATSSGVMGAEGLSGLAKSFFHAGAHSLLVSHWPVHSQSATSITTEMLSATETEGISKAEALRRAIVKLLTAPPNTYQGHPMFWAPFSIVGHGI